MASNRNWYQKFPVEIRPNIFMLGNYFFNLFLIAGEKETVLFETGVSGIVDTVIEQITAIGKPPDTIIPAHPHTDHITGLPGLMTRFPHARIVLAEGARSFIEHPKAGPGIILEDQFISGMLPKFGIIPQRPSLETIPDLTDSLTGNDHTTFDLGGLHLDLYRVGGHSPGNFIGHIPEEQIVFSSDSLGFHFPGRDFFPLFFTGLGDYLDTIEFITALAPKIICPGHQCPIYENSIHQAVNHSLATTRNMIDLIHRKEYPHPQLVEMLFKQYYVDEFTLYSPGNITNCIQLLIKRVSENGPLPGQD